MGQNKTAIRQNVLDGDNLPNAILNAVIAGFDVATIVNDTVEVLQQGDTTSFMFEATPDAIEQFADSFVAKVRSVAGELRGFEYIDKPVIRRRDDGTVTVEPDAEVGELQPDAEVADGVDEGIEVESAEEAVLDAPPASDLGGGLDSEADLGAPSGEETVQKVAVEDIEMDAILATQKPIGGDRFTGKVALKFPVSFAGMFPIKPGDALVKLGIDFDGLPDAVAEYVLDFIGRNAGEYFGGMSPETAARTLKFTEFAFSQSNDHAMVATFEVGGE